MRPRDRRRASLSLLVNEPTLPITGLIYTYLMFCCRCSSYESDIVATSSALSRETTSTRRFLAFPPGGKRMNSYPPGRMSLLVPLSRVADFSAFERQLMYWVTPRYYPEISRVVMGRVQSSRNDLQPKNLSPSLHPVVNRLSPFELVRMTQTSRSSGRPPQDPLLPPTSCSLTSRVKIP